jgi:hypothetical protein
MRNVLIFICVLALISSGGCTNPYPFRAKWDLTLMNRNAKAIDYYVHTSNMGFDHGFMYPGRTGTVGVLGHPLGETITFGWRYRKSEFYFIENTFVVPKWVGAGDDVNVYIIFLDNEDIVFKVVDQRGEGYMLDNTVQLYEGPIVKERIPEPEPEPRQENKLKHQKR